MGRSGRWLGFSINKTPTAPFDSPHPFSLPPCPCVFLQLRALPGFALGSFLMLKPACCVGRGSFWVAFNGSDGLVLFLSVFTSEDGVTISIIHVDILI